MAEQTSAVAKFDGAAIDAAMKTGAAGFQLQTMQDVFRFGEYVIQNRMAPKCFERPGQIVVAIQTGAETGLTPMASIRAIYVVPDSGTPSWTAEAMRGLVRRGFWDPWERTTTKVFHPGTNLTEGVVHDHQETDLKEDCTPQCYGWAKSYPKEMEGEPVETRFTVGMAMQANLWEARPKPKQNWTKYPFRMLQHRALSWHCRDNYSGILLGLQGADEAEEAAFGSPPRVRGSVIDTDRGAGKGDPIFEAPEPIVEAETEVVMCREHYDGRDPQCTLPYRHAGECRLEALPTANYLPTTEPPGPLFDTPEIDTTGAEFCAEHGDNPRDDCDTCCSIRMSKEDQVATLARLEKKDAEK